MTNPPAASHPAPDSAGPAAEPAAPAAPAAPAPHDAPAPVASGNWQDDVFDGSITFADLGLRSSVLKGLEAMGFSKPTRIQAKLIPPILAGKDVFGQAKTGTGKTAAFALPLLHMCDRGTTAQALVLVPTRELALQVAREINELGAATPITATAVIGGERITEQAKRLREGAPIVVSTPGRLFDMVQRGLLKLDKVRFAVLDEVDRMLDIGFRDDIRQILGMCPPPGQRQTIFTSATIAPDIERLARTHSKDAEKIVTAAGALTTNLVRQYYLAVNPWDKRRLLLHLLTHEEPALTVVFCRTKRTVDELADYLKRHNVDVHAMHGDMYQSKRNKVIDRLHKGDLSVLVASDLASRGLDVDGITHVVNYDLPEDPEVYVHRIGRTARIGREGVAWSFVLPDQGELLTNVEMLINLEVPKLEYPDFQPSPPPPGSRYASIPNATRGQGARVVSAIGPGLTHPSAAHAAARGDAAGAAAAPAGPGAPGHAPAPAAAPAPAPVVIPANDPSRFPGGIVPSKLPPKRMFGRGKGR